MAKNGKDLVKVVTQTEKSIKTLEDLKAELRLVETPKLVSGYLMVKDFATRVKKVSDAVREVLLFDSPESAEDKVFDGRFFLDDVDVDEKGHRYLNGEDGKQLKAEKRVSLKFNDERATEILKDRNLYDAATDKQVVGVNTEVLEKLEKLKEDLNAVGMGDFADRVDMILEDFEIVETLSEKKIEALVALEALSPEEVDLMYDTDVTYALKEQKNKRK